jgi:LysM repeat protein
MRVDTTTSPVLNNNAAANAAGTGRYTVERGDTVSAIAARYGVSQDALLAANPDIRNADLIFVGDKLNIPTAGRDVTVRPGDTLSGIAARNGTTVQALVQANNIDNPNLIFPGDRLRISSASSSASPPSSAGPSTAESKTTTPGAADAAGAQVTPGQLPNTAGLSESQKHDLYANYINQFGNATAKADLQNGKKVALSLRVDTNTNANQGLGRYDDRMVLVWQDKSGVKHAREFNANTEPSGWYEPGGQYSRKPVGADFNGDGRGDQGRLADGSYRYTVGTFLGARALMSGNDQVTERDTNHNGKFDDGVTSARGDYGMHTHIGNSNRTGSAGCLTLPPSEHARFFDTLGSQNSLSSVVVNTSRLAPASAPTGSPKGSPTEPAGSPATTGPNGLPRNSDPNTRALTDADWQRAATALGVDVAAIKAVAQVEAAGSGFLADGRPKILFEAHIFSDKTNGQFDRSNPNISSPRWNRELYAGGAGEYPRLQQAMNLDRNAALQSASWGKFQIMGFNHKAAGYNSVEAFVQDMYKSEGKQLDAFVNFIKADPAMHSALKRLDWAGFAERYNGPGYAANNYDTKMRDAYNRLN